MKETLEAINRMHADGVIGIDGVSTRIMSAEHLVAIALCTGRAKDHTRILQFFEQKAVGVGKLRKVLERYGLVPKWDEFGRKYLGDVHG